MDKGQSDDIQVDPLFVGLTRPATLFGVPMSAFLAEFFIVILVFLAVGNPLYLLSAVPLHGIVYLLSAENPRVFAEVWIWMQTTARCQNGKFWNGVSFSPRKTKRWEKE